MAPGGRFSDARESADKNGENAEQKEADVAFLQPYLRTGRGGGIG
jgi:hypothetical protein